MNPKIDLVYWGKSGTPDFDVIHGAAYLGDSNAPFIYNSSLNNTAFANIWNIPFVNDGSFKNYPSLIPCSGRKIVFAVYELSNPIKQWRAFWDQSPAAVVKNIRTAYPNAIILSTAKERKPIYNQFSRQFYENCDVITLPYGNSVISDVQSRHHSTVHSLPFPYLIHHIRSLLNSVSKKPNTIFLANNRARNYKQALEFGKHLQKKYGLTLVLPPPNMKWEDWLREIAQAEFCLNMDNTPNWGQVAIECAMLDCLHLGGKTDAAEALFPETATNDEAKLELFVERFLENAPMPDFQQRVWNRHSFEAFRIRLSEILKSEGYSPNLVN